jgi:hypothetical protein
MQATTSTRDPRYGVSSLAPDNERQRAEFYQLGLAGNHDEVRRRLAEAEDRARRHIWLRGMAGQ